MAVQSLLPQGKQTWCWFQAFGPKRMPGKHLSHKLPLNSSRTRTHTHTHTHTVTHRKKNSMLISNPVWDSSAVQLAFAATPFPQS